MAKTERAGPPAVAQEARMMVRIGMFRAAIRWRTSPLGNLSLGLGAAMVFGSIGFLVNQVMKARRARR